MIHSRRGQQQFLWMIRNRGHAPRPLGTHHLVHIQTPKFPQLPALMIPKVRSTSGAHTVKEKKPLPTKCGQRNKSPHTKWAPNSPAPRRGRRRNPAATRRRRRRRRRNSAASRRGRPRNSAANRRGRRRNSAATKDEEEDGNSDALRLGRRCR